MFKNTPLPLPCSSSRSGLCCRRVQQRVCVFVWKKMCTITSFSPTKATFYTDLDQIKQLKNVASPPGCLAHDHLQHNCVTFGKGGLLLRLRLWSPVCCVQELGVHAVGEEEEPEQTDRQTDRCQGLGSASSPETHICISNSSVYLKCFLEMSSD